MAYASGIKLSSLAGIVGAGVGGYIGYSQAASVSDLTPVGGALILGGVGLVAGSIGAFLLKSAMQFAIYLIMFGIVLYVFQGQIEPRCPRVALAPAAAAQLIVDAPALVALRAHDEKPASLQSHPPGRVDLFSDGLDLLLWD